VQRLSCFSSLCVHVPAEAEAGADAGDGATDASSAGSAGRPWINARAFAY